MNPIHNLIALLLPLTALSSTPVPHEAMRLQQGKAYLAAEANREGSAVFRALEGVREIPNALPERLSARDLEAIETGSELCEHPSDSLEERDYVMVVRYTAFSRSNLDENDNYRSNTTGVQSIRFRCKMKAKSFGHRQASWSCAKAD